MWVLRVIYSCVDFNLCDTQLQIILQTVISLVIVVYNIIQIVGDFKEIRATVDMQQKTWDTLGNFPSFYTFNHRGRALSPGYKPPRPNETDGH